MIKTVKIVLTTLSIMGCICSYGQHKNKIDAPANPVALQYLLSDYDLQGPVKQAGDMHFDKQGRLTKLDDDGMHSFVYEPGKIIVTRYGVTYHYVLNDKNQITSWGKPGEAAMATYAYDSHGNLIKESLNEDGYQTTIVYTYDAANRVTTMTEYYGDEPYETTFSYYDAPSALRITRIAGGDKSSATILIYNQGRLVNYEQMGALQRENVKTDTHGNLISWYSPVYGKTTSVTISYYTQ